MSRHAIHQQWSKSIVTKAREKSSGEQKREGLAQQTIQISPKSGHKIGRIAILYTNFVRCNITPLDRTIYGNPRQRHEEAGLVSLFLCLFVSCTTPPLTGLIIILLPTHFPTLHSTYRWEGDRRQGSRRSTRGQRWSPSRDCNRYRRRP